MPEDSAWTVHDRFLELRSHWFTLIGEHLTDHHGQPLEYWRVERAHSVIVLPLHNDTLLLPPPSYRPGINATTLDFPGGRLPADQTPAEAAIAILHRELGLPAHQIAHLDCLDPSGWPINTSFSNQRLYGVVAHIAPTATIAPAFLGQQVALTPSGIHTLLSAIACLQCRTLLLTWWYSSQRAQQDSNL